MISDRSTNANTFILILLRTENLSSHGGRNMLQDTLLQQPRASFYVRAAARDPGMRIQVTHRIFVWICSQCLDHNILVIFQVLLQQETHSKLATLCRCSKSIVEEFQQLLNAFVQWHTEA